MAFPTTRWSLLAQATIHGDAAQGEAVGQFYRHYRGPVLSFIRQQTPDQAHAEDLMQEFFIHLINESTLQRATPRRGRFRSFLLGALTRFLSRVRVRDAAEKRGGGKMPLSLDDPTRGIDEPVVPTSMAMAFDREWARDLLQRARKDLDTEWRARGEAEVLAVLLRFLPGAVNTPSYEEAAEALGWPQARLKTEVFRVRKQFRELVRLEVAITVDEPHEIDTEMAHLHLVLSDPSA